MEKLNLPTQHHFDTIKIQKTLEYLKNTDFNTINNIDSELLLKLAVIGMHADGVETFEQVFDHLLNTDILKIQKQYPKLYKKLLDISKTLE